MLLEGVVHPDEIGGLSGRQSADAGLGDLLVEVLESGGDISDVGGFELRLGSDRVGSIRTNEFGQGRRGLAIEWICSRTGRSEVAKAFAVTVALLRIEHPFAGVDHLAAQVGDDRGRTIAVHLNRSAQALFIGVSGWNQRVYASVGGNQFTWFKIHFEL